VGGGPATLIMRLQNNIAYQLSGEIYVDGHKRKSQVTETFGSRWHKPGADTNNIGNDPLFANRVCDFHLTNSSPAKDTGMTIVQITHSLLTPDQALTLRPMECCGHKGRPLILEPMRYSQALAHQNQILRRTWER